MKVILMTQSDHRISAVAPFEQQLRTLLDRAELSELIDRYVLTLDTADHRSRDIDWYRTIFTDDVRLTFPIGEHHGVSGLPEFQRHAKLWWKDTHHQSSNHVFEIDGDLAQLRAQLTATHVAHEADSAAPGSSHFDVGGFYEATAVRTARGWRIDRLDFTVVWSTGQGRV